MSSDYLYHKLECDTCKRKILVEMIMFGVAHHRRVIVTCAKCVGPLESEYVDGRPEAAKDIKEWLEE